jgi:3'(2'), 5'-bisphosphate nucleotidase
MYEVERRVAIELALEAGRAISALYVKATEVQFKAHHEPVTAADLASNRVIVDGLRMRMPGDAILSEEAKDDRVRLDHERVWIIDPLDGTKEYVDRNGEFAVMIGLAVGGVPVLGVVHQPVTGRTWHGVVGDGAELIEGDGSKRALRVSERTEAARLVLTRSHLFEGVDELRERLAIGELRQIGSVGLKVGAIAADEADLYAHISAHTKEWDACAPHAILEACGGTMTDLWGAPIRYNKPRLANAQGLLASNGAIHARAVEVVGPIAERLGMSKE